MKKLCGLSVLCLLVSMGLPAKGTTVTYSSSLGLGTTNWTQSVTLPKFDPSLGTLTSITYTLTGQVAGSAAFESKDADPAVVTMDLQAVMTLQRPDLTTLVVTIPVAHTSDSATAYDGTDDFGGKSGKTYSALAGSLTNTFTSFNPADFALFTGTGSIILPVVATGASTGSGAGNLLLQFSTQAGATAEITYNYVPEPATLALLALGGVGFIRRRHA